MRLMQRGGFWWVDYRTPEGYRRRTTTGVKVADDKSKAEAMRRACELVETTSTVATLTLAQVLDRTYREHWARLRSTRNMRHMADVLTREMGHHPVDEIDYRVLKAYAEALLRENLATATVNRRLGAISVALRECVRRGELKSRPEIPHYTENNKKERYVSPAEEAALLDWFSREAEAETVRKNADKAAEWAYLRNLMVFLIDTGFRFSEAFVFNLAQTGNHWYADLPRGISEDGRSLKTESSSRRVPLTARALAAAQAMVRSDIHDRLRSLPDKKPWDWVTHRWQVAVKACGCEDITLHILRHTCASRLVQRGVPIFTVSKWLGHSSVKVTERYAKLAPDSLSHALAALQGGPVLSVVSTPEEPLHGTETLHDGNDSSEKRHIV